MIRPSEHADKVSAQPPEVGQLENLVRWGEFERGLREENRFVPRDDKYFDMLFAAAIVTLTRLETGTEIHRARIMPLEKEYSSDALPITEMGQPPAQHRVEGYRLNPPGIGCFYGALETETAIAEMRAWPRARVTVATFRTVAPLNMVDLRTTSPLVQNSSALYWVAYMLSRPVHKDDRLGYIGTQYLAERLKAKGSPGILYGSALRAEGTNVALFSDSGLRPGMRTFHEITGVKYASALLWDEADEDEDDENILQ